MLKKIFLIIFFINIINIQAKANTCADGDCKNGKGKQIYDNGSIYIGNFKNNQRNGWGSCDFKDGSRYEGNWLDGNKNGFGTYFINSEVMNNFNELIKESANLDINNNIFIVRGWFENDTFLFKCNSHNDCINTIDKNVYDEAYQLSLNNNFQDAIEKVNTISKKSNIYNKAQKSIKIWNNNLLKSINNTSKISILDGKGIEVNLGFKKYIHLLGEHVVDKRNELRISDKINELLGPETGSEFPGSEFFWEKHGIKLYYHGYPGYNLNQIVLFHPFQGKTIKGLKVGDNRAKFLNLYKNKYKEIDNGDYYSYIMNNFFVFIRKKDNKVFEIQIKYN